MQQLVHNNSSAGCSNAKKLLHLKQEIRDKMFDDNSPVLTSDSDDNHSSSDEFSIDFSKTSSQKFGLDYWMNNNSSGVSSCNPLPCHRSVFINSKSSKEPSQSSNGASLSYSYQKPKKPKKPEIHIQAAHSQIDQSHSRSKDVNHVIPRLKIPKHVTKKHLKILPDKDKSINQSKLECLNDNCDPDCLKKSFDKPRGFCIESNSPLHVASHDVMQIRLTIDADVYSKFCSSSKNNHVIESNSLQRPNDIDKRPIDNMDLTSANRNLPDSKRQHNTSHSLYSESNNASLSICCDIQRKGLDSSINYSKPQKTETIDGQFEQIDITSRKRSIDFDGESNQEGTVPTKRKPKELSPEKAAVTQSECNAKTSHDISPIDLLKMLENRMKMYKNDICEKYCLSQPNAMKFLAQSHATNWEAYKSNLDKIHLVPCGFLSEIFHRALHCYGLERKIVKETMAGNESPMHGDSTASHCLEYKKVRDEYSFSLKRVRYGIGVIDELFRRKVNYQSAGQSGEDVVTVRKWKHIIYYLCLHAKSAFLAKEMQYQKYAQSNCCSFEASLETVTYGTPSLMCLSNVSTDSCCKSQLPKHCPDRHKTLSPDRLSQSDVDASPHSYDSGKGSSIQDASSHGASHRTTASSSSLNSTPHSNSATTFEAPQGLSSGIQLRRIDEYQSAASEYVRLLPEAAQLHRVIVARIGAEPNANARDNVVTVIRYADVCQQLCVQDRMTDCLRRLLAACV